jgi:hypothetical protein
LYLRQGNATIHANRVESFLDVLSHASSGLVSKDIPCRLCVYPISVGSSNTTWKLDLLKTASIMGRYPLLNFEFKLKVRGCTNVFENIDVASAVSVLRNMNVQAFNNMIYAKISLHPRRIRKSKNWDVKDMIAELEIVFKMGCTVPKRSEFGIDEERTGIKVEIFRRDMLPKTVGEDIRKAERKSQSETATKSL